MKLLQKIFVPGLVLVLALILFSVPVVAQEEGAESKSTTEEGTEASSEGELVEIEAELSEIEGELGDTDKEMKIIKIVHTGNDADMVVTGDDFTVEESELFEGDVAVTDGDVIVYGQLDGDATVVAGDITVYGIINGDVSATGGDIYIDGGEINGDAVMIGGELIIDNDGVFSGKEIHFGDDFDISLPCPISETIETYSNPVYSRILDAAKEVFFFIFLLFVGLLISVFMKRQSENISGHLLREFPRSSLLGLALLVAAPFAIILLGITIIGIPFIPLLVLALVIIALLAFVIFSKIIGEKIVGAKAHPMLQVFIGVTLLSLPRILGKLIEIVPDSFLNGLVGDIGEAISSIGWFVFMIAAVLGAGAIIYSRFGTSSVEKTRDKRATAEGRKNGNNGENGNESEEPKALQAGDDE